MSDHLVTVTRGDAIRIIPGKGPERVMVVSHVEHHVITLSDPDADRTPRSYDWQDANEEAAAREVFGTTP